MWARLTSLLSNIRKALTAIKHKQAKFAADEIY